MNWWKKNKKNRGKNHNSGNGKTHSHSFQNIMNQNNEHDEEEEEQDFQIGPRNGGEHDEDNIRRLPVPMSLTNGYFGSDRNKSGQTRFGSYREDDFDWENWSGGNYSYTPKTTKDFESYDFLEEYSQVFNFFTASTPAMSPYSNKAIYIIDVLSKIGIKFRVEVFPYSSMGFGNSAATDTTSHRLINIIAEPNPNVQGPALIFSAHHDVNNVRSENCQDNGASVCNLLRLASLIHQNPDESQRTLIVFTDCEEFGAKGARKFADGLLSGYKKTNQDSDIAEHETYGEIAGVLILELTGHGKAIWTDCTGSQKEQQLHRRLEDASKTKLPKFTTPPSDVYAFRGKVAALCIGTLKHEDLRFKSTWSICHSMRDTIDLCSKEDMKEFTEFLHSVSKIPVIETEQEDSQLELNLE